MSLSGKSAVVTGAGMGIGKAMTEILLLNGAKVAILDVNKTTLEGLKKDLDKQYGPEKTLFLECDVVSEQQFKAAFQKAVDTFGGVDVLVNNAGILNEAAWEKTVSVNIVGVIRGTYLALEHMNKLSGGRGGVVINMASMAVSDPDKQVPGKTVLRQTAYSYPICPGLGPLVCCPVYTATKHAVIGFTRTMAAAAELSGYGIQFNAICPSFVQTDLFSNIPTHLGQYSHLSEKKQELADDFGVINPSEVAEGLLQLLMDETKNGAALMVLPNKKEYVTFPKFS